MEITTRFFFCVVIIQQYSVLAYDQISRRHDSTSVCHYCDQVQACEIKVFCKVSGSTLRLTFEPLCAECDCTPLVVFLLTSDGGVVREHTNRQLDKFDRETVFNDLADGLYSVNIIRGDLVYNLTGTCEVSNNGEVLSHIVATFFKYRSCCDTKPTCSKELRGRNYYRVTDRHDQVEKSRVIIYLTIFGCVFFATIVMVGMFRFYKRRATIPTDTYDVIHTPVIHNSFLKPLSATHTYV